MVMETCILPGNANLKCHRDRVMIASSNPLDNKTRDNRQVLTVLLMKIINTCTLFNIS